MTFTTTASKRIVLLGTTALLIGCGGSGGTTSSQVSAPTGVNQPPTVSAGSDQTVVEGTSVTLAGTASDTDGNITTWQWAQTSGQTVTLANAGTAQPTFTAPDVDSTNTVQFSLTVTDDKGATASDSVSIDIADSVPITVTAKPDSVTKEAFATFEFTADGAASFECRLNDGEYIACETPHTVMPVDVGTHTFDIRALTEAGAASAPSRIDWTVSSLFGDAADSTVDAELIRSSVQPSPAEPNSWRGILRINCDFAHSDYDDPIVFPGQDNAAHLHRFYGNTLLDENSTTESLFTTGESSCQGNDLNRSAYWIPALIAPDYDPVAGTRNIDAMGDPAWKVVPAVVGNDDVAHEVFYYSAGVDDLQSIQPIPLGLKMIAGDGSSVPGQEQDSSIVRWHCQSWESSDATNPRWSASIPECTAPDRLRMDIFFPSCWDGVNLDSEDHKSHLAYPIQIGSGVSSETVCPADHPEPIIRVSFHYAFGVLPTVYDPVTRSSKGWRIASDMYTVDGQNPGGISLHGDWFNAWHPEALQAVLDTCIRGRLDCHDGNLANGYRLSGTRAGTQEEPMIMNMGHGVSHGN